MNELDIYYRALLEYRRAIAESRDCTAITSAIAAADSEGDKIVVTRARCTVDEDWVEAIEEGLVHIDKAIKEERQFIQSNGEVIPIEKVRHVSKDSVQHLAKHSNLITRIPEDEDIVPDKLYTVERLNDYAVYENRFLYMLLCYLRDFITIRYNKILDLTNKYEGTLDINKTVNVAKRKMEYTVSLREERKDDKYLREHNSARDTIDRIDLILKTVLAFLSTPLMECCSKVAMLKPPITKTNVLKMNNNFKGAVRLYDFIIAYDKPGFTVEKEINELSPLREDVSEELAEAAALVSFLTYEHGLGIKADLKERYNAEEKRRRNEELLRKTEQLEALGRRLKSSGISAEEYALQLEKHMRALTQECAKIEPMRKEIEELKASEAALTERVTELTAKNEELTAVLEAERERHEAEIAALKEEHARQMEEQKAHYEEELRLAEERHERELEELRLQHEAEISELKSLHEKEISELKEAHSNEIQRISERHEENMRLAEERHAQRLSALEERMAETKAIFEAELGTAKEEKDALLGTVAEKDSECQRLSESLVLSEGRIKAMRAERGTMSGSFTDKDSFDNLEREYTAFVRFYKSEWAKTKKQIRKNILNLENFKGKQSDNNSSD